MRIGMTYDLKEDYLKQGYSPEDTAEFDSEETVEAIEEALRQLEHEPVRIGGIHALVPRLAAGERWDLVFNICEGLHGIAREAQVPALLEAYRIPTTQSNALVIGLTLDKAATKRIVRDFGIPTPDFEVIRYLKDLDHIEMAYPLFVKPLGEGSSKGIDEHSYVKTPNELKETCHRLLQHFQQPLLVETFLPGREFSVGILGSGREANAIGVLEIRCKPSSERHAYTYFNKQEYLKLVTYRAATDPVALRARDYGLAVWNALECRGAGRVDMRCNMKGEPNFIEVNPLPGLNPVSSDLPILCRLVGLPYQRLIEGIVNEAVPKTALQDSSLQSKIA